MGKQKKSKNGAVAPLRPTIAVYQNPDHVAGILQQLHVAPLVTGESREHGVGDSSGDKTEVKGHGGGKGGVSVPLIGEVGFDASGDLARMQESGLTTSTRTTQNFTYSQAYYLFVVRDALRRRGLVQTITSVSDAADLSSGDFVEFQANFKPNALHALLDILTPDLISAITHHKVKADGLKLFPGYTEIDQLKIFSEGLHLKAQIRADIARATAEAVRVDFRAEKTREFYGAISSDVTAVTICDNAHFVVDDEDRILDGSFTVLGKVTSGVERDVPVLSRNKLLDRIGPDVVDILFGMLHEGAAEQVDKLELGKIELDVTDAFDLRLPSRIDGASFRVIPVAVFA